VVYYWFGLGDGNMGMKVTRRSVLTGIVRTLDLNITDDEVEAYNSGVLIQDAFPNLTPGEREFIKTGITDEEWDQAFGTDEDDT
jgi:hypothetical protein